MAHERKPEMGKYLLWCYFWKDPTVRKHLPATARFTLLRGQQYMRRYGTVFVKPVAGSRGRGIIKIERSPSGWSVQHTTRKPRQFKHADAAIRYADTLRAGQAYIVQQGIHLARCKGRPYDIRVMMQREAPGGAWKYSGMLAKVAGRGSVVTNLALGQGYVLSVPDALRQSFGWSDARIKQLTDKLVDLCLQASDHFDGYLKYRELGFDLAVDQNGRIWMIEQNTGPSHALFAHLKSDLTMYRTIQRRWSKYNQAKKRKA